MPVQSDYTDAQVMGYSGMPSTPDRCQYRPAYNAEASAKIAFGRAVIRKTSSPATDFDVLLPSSENDVVVGIVVRRPIELAWTDSAGTSHGQYDATGYLAGADMVIAKKGRLLLLVEDGCVPGDHLWVRAVAAGDPEFLGGLNSADDGTDMIDCTNAGQWDSTAAAGGLAWLDFDFTGDMT